MRRARRTGTPATGTPCREPPRFVAWNRPWSGLRIRLVPDEAYSYALWVEPEYRPGGVAAALVAAMLAGVQAETSIRVVYGWIDEHNRESQTLLRLIFGFSQVQRVKRVHVLRRVGWKLPRSDDPPLGPLSKRPPTAASR
jgi:RimJ/RimL family protein N-acetyltransferase